MFDNLFWLMGPVASAGSLFAVLVLLAAPAIWTTCDLSRGNLRLR
jgi:hypothetical protein